MFSLYNKQRELAMSQDMRNTGLQVKSFMNKYKQNLKEETHIPVGQQAPEQVKTEFLNLISIAIQSLTELSLSNFSISSLLNIVRILRRLVSIYSLSARKYLLKDSDFLFQSRTGLEILRESLEGIISKVADKQMEIQGESYDRNEQQINPQFRQISRLSQSEVADMQFLYNTINLMLSDLLQLLDRMIKTQQITINQLNRTAALYGQLQENALFRELSPAEEIFGKDRSQ
jgi:hypothetical protein